MTTLTFEDGKYTYINDEQGQRALRYGEPWRNLVGDKFVYCMAAEIERLRARVAELEEMTGELTDAHDEIEKQAKHIAELGSEVVKWKSTAEQHKDNYDILNGDLRLKNSELTKQRDDLLAVVEHIRRCIPSGGFAQIHDGSATVADMDAAIDRVKGELK